MFRQDILEGNWQKKNGKKLAWSQFPTQRNGVGVRISHIPPRSTISYFSSKTMSFTDTFDVIELYQDDKKEWDQISCATCINWRFDYLRTTHTKKHVSYISKWKIRQVELKLKKPFPSGLEFGMEKWWWGYRVYTLYIFLSQKNACKYQHIKQCDDNTKQHNKMQLKTG